MSWKTSPLVKCEILGLFGNTFTADYMYSRHRWEELMQQVHMLLSEKARTFSENFIAFSESKQNFPHFEKENQIHCLNILEVIHPDKCGYFSSQKVLF